MYVFFLKNIFIIVKDVLFLKNIPIFVRDVFRVLLYQIEFGKASWGIQKLKFRSKIGWIREWFDSNQM